MTVAFVFPGQGTQRPGMGSWLLHRSAQARAIFDRASEIVGSDVAAICGTNDAAVLRQTVNAQPALFTVGAAGLAHATSLGWVASVYAGHSVGEFNALVAAGVLTFEDALTAVCERAELMASVTQPGAMAAIAGLDESVVVELCARASRRGPTTIALVNAPGYFVISGAVAGVEEAARLARAAGATRVTALQVSGAFHSPLMDEVAEAWRAVVAGLTIQSPDTTVVLNTTGDVAADEPAIRGAIVDQLTCTVEWSASMQRMRQLGVDHLVEIGDSKTLVSLARLQDRRGWKCSTLEALGPAEHPVGGSLAALNG